MPGRSDKPTIRTVAARAGVSKSLVSLYLQRSAKVGADSRAAIESAIADLDYRPNLLAQSLSARRSGVIGVIVNDLRNPWYVDCFGGFVAVAQEQGYRALLADAALDLAADGSLLDAILRLQVDGLVILGTTRPSPALLAAIGQRPTVVAAARDLDDANVDVVSGDDDAGIGLALDHLVALGHRRIAHVTGGVGAVSSIRRESFERRAAAAGVSASVIEGDGTEGGGFAATRVILDRPDRATAVIAFNDLTGVGSLSAARASGLDVPHDLSVIGFDDSLLAGLGVTQLTSIDGSSEEVGALAAHALLARIEDPGRAAQEQLVLPRLIVRTSTAPPR